MDEEHGMLESRTLLFIYEYQKEQNRTAENRRAKHKGQSHLCIFAQVHATLLMLLPQAIRKHKKSHAG